MARIEFANYGQIRETDATIGEKDIFLTICAIVSAAGQDPNELALVRKSGGYVSAAIGRSDVARFKFTDRTRWIVLPYSGTDKDKREISAPEDVQQWPRDILAHYHLALANKLLYE